MTLRNPSVDDYIIIILKIACCFSKLLRSKQFLCNKTDRGRPSALGKWLKEENPKFKDWLPLTKNRPPGGDGHGGVAIFAHPSVKITPLKSLENETEVVWSRVAIDNRVIHVASVYIPPGKIQHIRRLRETLQTLPNDTPIVLGGDFNATSRLWDNRENIPRNSASFQLGQELEELIAEQGLKVHNTGHYTYTKHNSNTGVTTCTAIDLLTKRSSHEV